MTVNSPILRSFNLFQSLAKILALNLKTYPVTLNNLFNEPYLRQSMTLPKASCSTLLTVAATTLALLLSKLISPNGKVTSFGDQFSGLSSKNWGPWNQWGKSKWAKDMERIEISAGFDEGGIWNQISGDQFLFWTQIFQRYLTCFIHHKTTMLSL